MSNDGGPPREPAADLRLRTVRALRGPSLWATHPVVACDVEAGGVLVRQPPASVPGMEDGLAASLPALAASSIDDRASTPAAWAELVGRVAAALQTLAGSPVTFVAVMVGQGDDAPQLAVGYAEEDAGIESLYAAAELVTRCANGEPVDAGRAVEAVRGAYLRAHPEPTAWLLMEAARQRGIPVRRFEDDPVIQLGLGRTLRRLDGAMTDFTSVIAADIISHKDRTRRVLARHGLPVPRGGVAERLEDALEMAEDLGYPVRVKPLDAHDGRGISGRLDTPEAVRVAWRAAHAEHSRVVVEPFVDGRDHRVLVVNGRVVAVAERVPAHIVGDGARTIRELAGEANRDPRRNPHDPAAPRVPLPLDEATARYLERCGHTLDSVPAAGERVQLRGAGNISTGGTSIDRTDDLHPRNAALCVLAAGAVGLDVAGIDVLTSDISVPFDQNGAAIIEVNARPGLRMHADPDQGAPRDAAGAILDMLYPPGAPTTIP
ncbi:MAG TPA: hypothetical protein VFJ16_05810, partial [Longimicrobium sp.]|nr:hypothetical protein [Longimicrobium sp.]